MRDFRSGMLKSRALNGWGLFWLITAPISLAMLMAMAVSDLTSGEGVSAMIQLSVRCAVPWLYLAFAASSIQTLFPRSFSRWLLRNRKFLGLCFAAAMAWQGLFILWLVLGHTDYYVKEVYVLRDLIEGLGGYLFLLAMTATSFPKGRKLLKPKAWRRLHLGGIYFLWAYAFSVYWWALNYYGNPVPLDHALYWTGLGAWALRMAAWSRKRRQAAWKASPGIGAQPLAKTVGAVLIAAGLVAAGAGSAWQGMAETVLYGHSITQIPELYLPYWPFEPFLPLAAIALGAFLFVPRGGVVQARAAGA